MVGITKISSGIINVSDMKRVEKIMQKYISFFCCNSIEEFCEIYDFDFSILKSIAIHKLVIYKRNFRLKY